MITPSDRPPFEVRFHSREGDRVLEGFTTALDAPGADFTPGLSFAENQDISVLFRAPQGFRLTMDGLDVVYVQGAYRDGGEAFLTPDGRYTTVFEAKNFPLVPGYYVVRAEGRGRVWKSIIEILPRYMGKQQWQDMRDELMGEIRRLSFDFMKRSMHIDPVLEGALGIESGMLLRFYIVNDLFDRVLHVTSELAHTANSRIALRTRRVRTETVREGAHTRTGPRTGAPYTAVRRVETTWDVAENRFAKTILLRLDRNLRDFIEKIDENIARVAGEQEEAKRYKKDYQYRLRSEAMKRFQSYRRRAARLALAIREARDAPWFAETETARVIAADTTVARDPRYAVLSQLHRNLRHPEESLSVSSFYRFQWKRTDKLYELWCVLTFVKALASKGWQMEKGPAVTSDGSNYILESLDAGTSLLMRRGAETLRLVYDDPIPASAADTDARTAPLYTNNPHRRPDLRIDYYRDEKYCGSLVADFKYRDIYKLWGDRATSAELRLQFNAYRDMNTKFYRDMDERTSLRDSRPVKEVWAVFPKETPAAADEDYSLRFIALAPGLAANDSLPGALDAYFEALSDE